MEEKKQLTVSTQTENRHQLQKYWQSVEISGGVTKLETGIAGFDELLEGGLPKGRSTLVSAGTGCGKTVLLCEFLYRGITQYNQAGLFVTFEERQDEILCNLRNFGWKIDEIHESGMLKFIDGSPPDVREVKIGQADWLEPVIGQIKFVVEKIGAQRLAIDNLGTLFTRYGDEDANKSIREQLFYFADAIKKMNVTALISTERHENNNVLSQYGVENFVSDGLIELDAHAGENTEIRTMRVRKLRGVGYRSGKVTFQITKHGLEVFPKIPINPDQIVTDVTEREKTGIASLDTALGGGIPIGHIMLIAGNTGAGKTTLSLHYILEGLKQGETCTWVALEESQQQILTTAETHGWSLTHYVERGLLRFIQSSLLDIMPDKLLYQICDQVLGNGAKRIVIDSISSLESATLNKDKVREFLLQLTGFAKANKLTVVLNYLTGGTFGAGRGQLLGALTTNAMRLSSIVDGILLLRFVERGQRVNKLLNILKLRGSRHTKDILQYDINRQGFSLGTKFTSDD